MKINWETDEEMNTLCELRSFLDLSCKTCMNNGTDDCPETKKLKPKASRYDYHTAYGQTRTVVEWAQLYSINPKTLMERFRRGMSMEEALQVKARAPAEV